MNEPTIQKARKVIEDLLDHPPSSPQELAVRRGEVSEAALRHALVDRLEGGEVGGGVTDAREAELMIGLFRELGVDEQVLRLVRLVGDGGGDALTRRVVLSALMTDRGTPKRIVLQRVPPKELLGLLSDGWSALVEAAPEDPEARALIVEMLATLPGAGRAEVFEYLDDIRQQTGVSAAAAYGAVLCSKALAPVHKLVVELIARECQVKDIPLLEALVGQTQRKAVRRELQRVLNQARALEVHGSRSAGASRTPQGTAHVGVCDGQGAYTVTALVHRRDDEYVLTQICIRAAADVRDGLSENHRAQRDLEEVLGQMRKTVDLPFVQVSLAEAAALVREGVERTERMGRALPEGTRLGIRMLSRVDPARFHADDLIDGGGPAADDPEAAKVEGLRAALARPEYRWWFFDAGDLVGAGVAAPPAEPGAEWIEEAERRIAGREAIRERVLGMTRHMARWHDMRGEGELATLLAAAHRATRAGGRVLIRAMLEHTLALRHARAEGQRTMLGDPDQRRYLRGRLMADVQRPLGLDLATLDFTEVAYLGLDEEVQRLPGEARPRSDQLEELALELGRGFAEIMTRLSEHGDAWADRQVDRLIGLVTGQLRVDRAQAEPLVWELMGRVRDLVRNVCLQCPVGCLVAPEADVASAFFAPAHPAAALLSKR